jgi:hypothetical protein
MSCCIHLLWYVLHFVATKRLTWKLPYIFLQHREKKLKLSYCLLEFLWLHQNPNTEGNVISIAFLQLFHLCFQLAFNLLLLNCHLINENMLGFVIVLDNNILLLQLSDHHFYFHKLLYKFILIMLLGSCIIHGRHHENGCQNSFSLRVFSSSFKS